MMLSTHQEGPGAGQRSWSVRSSWGVCIAGRRGHDLRIEGAGEAGKAGAAPRRSATAPRGLKPRRPPADRRSAMITGDDKMPSIGSAMRAPEKSANAETRTLYRAVSPSVTGRSKGFYPPSFPAAASLPTPRDEIAHGFATRLSHKWRGAASSPGHYRRSPPTSTRALPPPYSRCCSFCRPGGRLRTSGAILAEQHGLCGQAARPWREG
jgi:hypothetical protein